MADFIITDIVSESAILSVRNLTNELNNSKSAFAQYAAEIAQASSGASKSFADLEAKVKAFEAQQKQMAQQQAQYNASMADLKKKLADVEAQLQAAAKAQQQQAQSTQAATQANNQQAQSAQTAAQAAEQQRAAALANIKAIEEQKAALLGTTQVTEQNKQKMEEVLGTIDSNAERLAVLNQQIATNNAAISANNAKLVELADYYRQASEAEDKHVQIEGQGSVSAEQLKQRYDDLVKTQAVLVRDTNELKTSKQEVQRVMKSEQKAAQEADGSYKQVSLTLSQLKDTYKQLSAEERNSSVGQGMLAQIQALDEQLKGTGATMGEHQRNVGNYEQAILGALGVNNRFASSILNMTRDGGGGLAGFFSQAGTAVKSFGASLMTLLTNPVFLTIAGIGGAVAAGKWFFDYNQGLAEASRLTSELTGKMGEDMQAYRNEVQAVADTYGKDYKETLQSAETLVTQFGISWEEAIGMINKGFAAGADLNGTFLSQINQFAPSFRDANVSASEFVATIGNTRQGIFTDQGMNMMQMAFKKLREGSDSTKEALAGINIDVDKLYAEMASGVTSPIDALKQVSEHLGDVGENSEAAGAVLKDVFGRQGAQGGMKMVKELKNVETDLDKVLEQTGEWGKLQLELTESQEDLNDAMSALFDVTDNGWENFITQVKIIVNEWLVEMIKKVIEIINWFIDWYNESALVRGGLAMIWANIKNVWTAAKTLVNVIIDGFKLVIKQIREVGNAFGGMFDILTGDFSKGWNKITSAVSNSVGNFKAYGNELGTDLMNGFYEGIANYRGAGDTMLNGHLNRITYNPQGHVSGGGGSGAGGGGGNGNGNGSGSGSRSGGGRSGGRGGRSRTQTQAQREANEQAKYEQMIQEKINAVRMEMMGKGYEQERAKAQANWDERFAEIRGNSAKEEELRTLYTEQMNAELAAMEAKHTDDLRAIDEQNIQNRLDTFAEDQKNTEEYHALRLQLIEVQRLRALYAAEQEGLDDIAVNEKFYRMLLDAQDEYNRAKYDKQINAATELQAKMTMQRKKEYQDELAALAKQLQDGLITREFYNQEVQRVTQVYSIQEAEAAVSNAKQMLKNQKLTAEQRKDLEQQLANAEIALTQAKIKVIEDAETQAAEAEQKRIQKIIDTIQTAQKFMTEFANLGNAIFDNEAQKLEEAQDALDKAYEREGERIEKLQEQGTISTEEAERRKTQAEKRHAAEKEKLEKKQAELKKRQAIFDKANNASQTIMNTAVAIMNAWATGKTLADKIAQTAIISALGAVQLATILAQPIPKYAKGTDSHKGGLAIVGDAGKRELVITAGSAWITPNTPTLVDMPKGAYVHPNADLLLAQADIRKADAVLRMAENGIAPVVNVENDYTRLERATLENAKEIRTLQKIVSRNYVDAEYYKQYGRI